TATRLDFSTTPLSQSYSPFFALLLSNVFTPSECASLITHAESSTPWTPAVVGSGSESTATVYQNFRHSSHILLDDATLAETIYTRIHPFLSSAGVCEIGPDSPWLEVTGKNAQKWSKARGETGFWRMVGLNPRLRFLSYGPGEYFKPHCDALYDDPSAQPQRKSFLTVHAYLSNDGVEGGETRFWTPDKKHWVDVEPEVGRVLVFQQRMLVHSGEEVKGGNKVTVRTDVMFEKV
ncbi:hypothetical protein K440DRAFT_512713, partial [Wilcoxina mikolae CBS 423.85]